MSRNGHGRKPKDSCSPKVYAFLLLVVSMTTTVRVARRRRRSK